MGRRSLASDEDEWLQRSNTILGLHVDVCITSNVALPRGKGGTALLCAAPVAQLVRARVL